MMFHLIILFIVAGATIGLAYSVCRALQLDAKRSHQVSCCVAALLVLLLIWMRGMPRL